MPEGSETYKPPEAHSEALQEQARIAEEQAAIKNAMDAANPKDRELLERTYQRTEQMIDLLGLIDRQTNTRHVPPMRPTGPMMTVDVDQVYAAKMRDFWKIK
jgi:hypothetical protein